jgi:capsid protein
MSLAMGAIKLPPQKFEKFNKPYWIGRRWQWVDPLKDVLANAEAVKQGFKTNSQVISEQGGDIYEVYEQLKLENELKIQYGITNNDTDEEIKRHFIETDEEGSNPSKRRNSKSREPKHSNVLGIIRNAL